MKREFSESMSESQDVAFIPIYMDRHTVEHITHQWTCGNNNSSHSWHLNLFHSHPVRHRQLLYSILWVKKLRLRERQSFV